MKWLSLIFLLSCLIACDSLKKESQIQKLNSKDISLGPIRHDSLTADQLNKVQRIQMTFAEVFPASLEETITNFKRDQHPDKEIEIWLNMAAAYEKFISKDPLADSAKKKDTFRLLLLRSMMTNEEAIKEAQIKHLSD